MHIKAFVNIALQQKADFRFVTVGEFFRMRNDMCGVQNGYFVCISDRTEGTKLKSKFERSTSIRPVAGKVSWRSFAAMLNLTGS